jgi:hypothetical protein
MKTPSSTPARRRWVLWLLLPAVALSVLAWLDDADSPADAGQTGRARRAPAGAVPAPQQYADTSAAGRLAQAVDRLELPPAAKSGHADPADSGESSDAAIAAKPPIDLLAARSWYVAPPPPPPEAPKPPPLPFKVLGQMIEGDAPAVFLVNQDRNLVAREGVRLDNTYLVERIEKDRMTLIYLPLATRQYLNLGAVN